MSSDNDLKKAVLDELGWEPSVNEAHIGVTAHSGVITLTGHVSSYMHKVAARLQKGEPVRSIRDVRGTAVVLRKGEWEAIEPSTYVTDGKAVILPSHEAALADKTAFAEMSRAFQFETLPDSVIFPPCAATLIVSGS